MKILIVDDSPTNRKLLRVTLQAEGHGTVEAGDGVEALATLERELVDAVISDILMPNMDGYRLCHEVRLSPKFKDIAFIHYTGTYVSADDQKLSAAVGADKYLTKPLSTRLLLEALNAAVSSSTARNPSTAKDSDTEFVMKQYSQTLVNKLEERNAEVEKNQAALFRTNEKLMEQAEELDQLNAGLEQRVRERTAEVEMASEELRRKHDETQKFYHTLSHELKTPLTSALEFVSLVMEGLAGTVNETQTEYLGIALHSCKQLHACINDLLDASRLETGKLSIEVQASSLAALVKRAVASLELTATNKGVALRHQVQPNLPDIPFDEQRMTQVMTNLINNALKFTGSGGVVTVSVGEAPTLPDFLCVSVRDTGRGIPEDELGRIFDRLYQIKDGDATNEQGFGLGLYLCRELVQMHGGRIWAESEPDKGSVFTFLLPKQPHVKPTMVMVVEDDADVRDLVKHTLEGAEFVVVTAHGGKAALQLTRNHRPDLVVLDLNLPDIDGPEVLKQLRQRWGALPVLVFTGLPDGELMTRALESGPFTLLTKPCNPDELVATLRRLKKQEETGFWKSNVHGRNSEPVVSSNSESQHHGDLAPPEPYDRRQKVPQRSVRVA
ncbi:MAG TPA: response regulator [Verrucomicrobiae bacterium]|nr:response regulator [Verrucomicrobiae bacterium]